MIGIIPQAGSSSGETTEEIVKLTQPYTLLSLDQQNSQKEFNEKTHEILKKLMPKVDYVKPVISVSGQYSGDEFLEIDAPINIRYGVHFNKNHAGELVKYRILKPSQVSYGNPIIKEVDVTETVRNASYYYNGQYSSEKKVPKGNLYLRVIAEYKEGEIKENSIGFPITEGHIVAGEIEGVYSMNCVYPTFIGTLEPNETIDDINLKKTNKRLVSMTGYFSQYFNFTGKKILILRPALYSGYKHKDWFISELNKGSIGNAGDLFEAPITKNFNSPDNYWQNIEYNVYISSVTNLKGTIHLK